jgi:hypothetical protein
MVMHIGSQKQTPEIQPKNNELEDKLDEAEKRIMALTWMNSLADDKTFRLELLQSIERMNETFKEGFNKLIDITSK